MKGWQWSGGGFEPCDSVPLEDRGFRYGMSVFETIAIVGGRPHFLNEHLARIAAAAAECGFATAEGSCAALGALLRNVGGDGVARIYVTADARIFVLAERREGNPGVSFTLAPDPFAHLPFPARLKTGNYWRHVAVVEEARAEGFDEALLVTPDGFVISACMANLFIVEGDVLKTPALASGARDGVVRDWILAGRAAEEVLLRFEDVARAQEIFLTNSWIGVMPVSLFRKDLAAPGPVTRGLMERYRAHIAGD